MLKSRSWHEDASCSSHPDPDLWHYENSIYDDEKQLQVLRSVEAIQICQTCPVKLECLAQGMEEENIIWSIGGVGTIWGGLLASERARKSGYKLNHNAVWGERRHARQVREKLGKLVR